MGVRVHEAGQAYVRFFYVFPAQFAQPGPAAPDLAAGRLQICLRSQTKKVECLSSSSHQADTTNTAKRRDT